MLHVKPRRLATCVAALAVAAAVVGCARNTAQQEPIYPPPPAAGTAPAPADGSTRQWTSPSAPAAKYAVTNLLHLRAAPGVNNTIIATLPAGSQVQATGSQQGDWWEVQTPQGTGWVSSHYLTPG